MSTNGKANSSFATTKTKPARNVEKPLCSEVFISWIKPLEFYTQNGRFYAYRRVSGKFFKWINYVLPTLQMSKRKLATYLREKDGRARLRKDSLRLAKAEPKRAAKRSRAQTAIRQCDSQIEYLEKKRGWLRFLHSFISPETESWSRKSGPLFSLAMVPSFAGLLFWATNFVLLVTAELSSSTNLLMSSGLGFAGSALSSFFAVTVVVLLPLATLKFLDANLGNRGQEIFDKILVAIALPLSGVIIYVFARTIGASHDDASLLDGATNDGFSYGTLYLCSMLGLALAVAMAGKSLKRTCEHFFVIKPTTNPKHESMRARLEELDNAIDGVESDCNEMRRVIQDLDAEALRFADDSCDAFADLKRRFSQSQDRFLDGETE